MKKIVFVLVSLFMLLGFSGAAFCTTTLIGTGDKDNGMKIDTDANVEFLLYT
ncbi:MAG: hypothetical protein HQK65_15715 [Desulfamplus sp.]|nr:hypothetical protein [Desulfamplus sp.]